MNNRSMFPFRRNGKKRAKAGPGGLGGPGAPTNAPNRQHRDQGGRRPPGSAQEMLHVLQPTTKALAQMLAGHVRVSGQLAHARSVLAQAQRLVEERSVDRLPPAHREEFLEQLARLKLTLADADDMDGEIMPPAVGESRPLAPMAPERLLEVARRLAASEPTAPLAPIHQPVMQDEPEDEPAPQAEPVIGSSANARADRLRLRLTPGVSETQAPPRVPARLRLKPLKAASEPAGD